MTERNKHRKKSGYVLIMDSGINEIKVQIRIATLSPHRLLINHSYYVKYCYLLFKWRINVHKMVLYIWRGKNKKICESKFTDLTLLG